MLLDAVAVLPEPQNAPALLQDAGTVAAGVIERSCIVPRRCKWNNTNTLLQSSLTMRLVLPVPTSAALLQSFQTLQMVFLET